MQYFLDISLVALVSITIVLAVRRGFVRSIFGMTKTLVAVILAAIFGPMASAWVADYLVTERVNGYVYERLLALFEEGAERFDLSTVLGRLPDWLTSLLERTGIDPAALVGDLTGVTDANSETLQVFAAKLSSPVSGFLSDLIGYAEVFLVSWLALSILAFLLGKLVKLPVLKQIDRGLGLALGIITALIYASIYTILIYAVFSLCQGMWDGFAFHEIFEKTKIFKAMYEFNLIRWFFGIG